MTEFAKLYRIAEEWAELRVDGLPNYGGAQIYSRDDVEQYMQEAFLAGHHSAHKSLCETIDALNRSLELLEEVYSYKPNCDWLTRKDKLIEDIQK